MATNIIPQEDNTSDILKDDLLKYGFINKKNKIRRHRANANLADPQERAIRLLKEERRNLEIKMKSFACKKYVKEDVKYKAKFAELIHHIKQSEIEFNEERKKEVEIDKEILRLEIELNKPENRVIIETRKIFHGDMNIEYNKLINEQNQLRVKVESSLKRLQQVQNMCNSLMKKLEKGQQISFVLSEQVMRIQKQKNDAKERLEVYLKMNNLQDEEEQKNITLLWRQLKEDVTLTEFLSEKLKKRESKKPEESIEQNTVLSALNAEAKEFVKYLIYSADEQNLEKIMEIIIKMDLDNKSMFEFLISLDLHLTEAENAIERARTSVADRTRVLSDMHAAKTEQLARHVRAYKSGRVPLREACRASRLMAAEWRRVCQAVDDVRYQLMDEVDEDELLNRGADADDEANAAGGSRRPPIDMAELVAYFVPIERRLDDVLCRAIWTQDNVDRSVAGQPRPHHQPEEKVATGESMSTGSEQGDEFVVRDLDGYNNRQAKILGATDPNAIELEFEPIDAGLVPSLCPECWEKRPQEDENEGVLMNKMPVVDGDNNGTHVNVMCNRENVSLKDVNDKQYKTYFHRTVDCPVYTIE